MKSFLCNDATRDRTLLLMFVFSYSQSGWRTYPNRWGTRRTTGRWPDTWYCRFRPAGTPRYTQTVRCGGRWSLSRWCARSPPCSGIHIQPLEERKPKQCVVDIHVHTDVNSLIIVIRKLPNARFPCWCDLNEHHDRQILTDRRNYLMRIETFFCDSLSFHTVRLRLSY